MYFAFNSLFDFQIGQNIKETQLHINQGIRTLLFLTIQLLLFQSIHPIFLQNFDRKQIHKDFIIIFLKLKCITVIAVK